MSDRIAVMSRGRVEQIGTPEEIYDAPGEHLRRRLHRLGQPAAGHARAATATARRSPCSTPAPRLAVAGVGEARDGDPVTVMLRPERITVGADDAGRRPQPAGDGQGRDLPGLVAAADRRRRRATPSCSSPSRPTTTRRTCAPATRITLRWSPGAAYLLRGRSEIIGATTTDVDEVQASMDGKDVAEATADGAAATEGAAGSTAGRCSSAAASSPSARSAPSLLSGVGGGDDGGGGGARRVRRRRGRRRHRPGRRRASTSSTGPSTSTRPRTARSARSTASRTRPASPSTTPRRSTTTTRSTARSSPPTSTPATRRLGHRHARRTGWRPA